MAITAGGRFFSRLLFLLYYGEEPVRKLECLSVAAENIVLKPRLLNK